MKASVSIYALRDPLTGTIRYIGQTGSGRLQRRLRDHLYEAKRDRPFPNRRVLWLRRLQALDLVPRMVELVRVEANVADDVERLVIINYLRAGHWLLNTTLGGDGVRSDEYPDDLREKQRLNQLGKKATEETRRKMRESHARRPKPSPEVVARRVATRRANGGWVVSLDARQRIASKIKALWSNPEYRDAMTRARNKSQTSVPCKDAA